MATNSSENSAMKGRDNKVSKDKYGLLGPILADVGGELSRIVGGDPDGAYLYAEAGPGWYGYAVFKDEGAGVRYFRGTSELGDLIWEAWNAEDSDKRWAVMEYEINGTKFDVKFQFPDEIDPNESEMDRRPRALKRRFGDKPVIYPLPPS